MMRTFQTVTGIGLTLGTALIALGAPRSTERPVATTQACLGADLQTFLACPPGAHVAGTECRADSTDRHWSGSMRQGPAVFLRDEAETDPAKIRVRFVATYKDHKKQGRSFTFDADGKLESFADMTDDDYHGLAVDCTPDGRVSDLAYYDHGKVVGITRHWRSDGGFAFAYDQNRRMSVTVGKQLEVSPDALCQPQRCDVNAAPDLSGLPAK
jgi:hypothetical protein